MTSLAIDDINQMDQPRDCVHTQLHNERFRRVTAFALLIAIFYFKLTCLPLYQNGKLHYTGTVRCWLKGSVMCQSINRVHPGSLIFKADQDVIGQYRGEDDLCGSCHRYRKKVESSVRHLDDPLTISMDSTLRGKRRISGFP